MKNYPLSRSDLYNDGVIGLDEFNQVKCNIMKTCDTRPQEPIPQSADCRSDNSLTLPWRRLEGVILHYVHPAREIVFSSHFTGPAIVEVSSYVEREMCFFDVFFEATP